MKVAGVNGEVLKWAREEVVGMTLESVAAKMNQSQATILGWESGLDSPTYCQLETLSYKLYKTPLAVFFFPEPPRQKSALPEFRLYPGAELDRSNRDTRLAIREMLARQESLYELTGGRNPLLSPLPQLEQHPPIQAATKLRTLMGVTLEEQMFWKDSSEAMKHWRTKVEALGIYVFKRSFREQGVQGFCLTDMNFPVICINNSTSPTRQIFSLMHELSHLMCATNGFTKQDLAYMEHLAPANQRLETQCNQVAAEVLVPSSAFETHAASFDGSEEGVAKIAKVFKVSREVICRKLMQAGKVSQRDYDTWRHQWNNEWLTRVKSGGGNFYKTTMTYLGDAYIKLGLAHYYSGRVSKMEVSEHFGIKVSQLSHIENLYIGV